MKKNQKPQQAEATIDQAEGQKLPPGSYENLLKNGITSIWFGAHISNVQSVKKRLDLEPHAALCLLIMATENATSSLQIQASLHGFGGGTFERGEAAIISELGLKSLRDIGYIRLDAKGEQEYHDHAMEFHHLGLGYVQWRLTSKGARRIAPTYCTAKGLPSFHQDQAVKDMLAANKAAIAKHRESNK